MLVGVAEEPSLFDIEPSRPEFEQPADRFWGAVGVKWSAYRGSHQPCAVYVRLVHQKGVPAVPRHLPAAKRRKGPNDEILVCSMCAVDLEAMDATAESERAARVAAVEEQTRAKRAQARKLA